MTERAPLLSIRDVSFAYPQGENTLDGVSFDVAAGELVTLLGPNGSGKAPLLNCIMNLLEPQQGSILLEGTPVRDWGQRGIAQRIAYVPQKAWLFSGTVASNLRFGNEGAGEAEMRHALDVAQGHFVYELPGRLQAKVSQGGTNFSGGQRQRLSIARALMKRADLYIFDDSFSALDFKTDAALRRALSPDMALEAFVHGAMCVAYSGRCLLSAALTGRSANRGACAQPCRWRYHLTEEKRPGEFLPVYEDGRGTYLYSAGDLCMIGHLDRLRDAGVASLKIEGRMKTAYYVATVVSAYRRALDLLEREGAEAYRRAVPELLAEVRKASHRTLTTGFYFGPPETPGGAEGFTQSMEYVGDVIAGAPDGGECLVRLKNRFYVGDALEVLTPEGPRAFTVSRMTLDTTGESVQTASVAGTLLRMPIPGGAGAGDLLRGPCRNHRSL